MDADEVRAGARTRRDALCEMAARFPLYVPSLYATEVDAATGLPRWDYRADGIVNIAAPLIVDGRVYLAGGRESDHVHAIDAA